jgi:hypothetical protein
MSEEPKMTAFMVALNFQNGPLVLNAVLAPTDYAAVAMVTAGSIQGMKIEQPLQGCAVMALTPEFLDAARQGGKPATIVSLVQLEPERSAADRDRTSLPYKGGGPVPDDPLPPSPAMTMLFGQKPWVPFDPEPPAA